MRVVIVGAGTVGIQIARHLIAENRDVILIEKNPETARIADNELDCLVINEDGSRPETLRMARAGQADWFLALTGSDSVNIVACGLVSAEAERPKTIARVETPFYSALSSSQQEAFGLDILVNPALEAARAIIQIMDTGFAESVVPLHDGALQLRMVPASSFPASVGKTLAEVRRESQSIYLVAAIVRNSRILVPRGDTRIEKGDRLYILGEPEALDVFLGKVEGLADEARRILLVGASRITERLLSLMTDAKTTRTSRTGGSSGTGGRFSDFRNYIAQRLFPGKIDITLVEPSADEGKRFAQLYQSIQVIHGDPQEEGVLESCGVGKSDLCIAATESQPLNIVTAELSKALGAKKSISIVTGDRYLVLGPQLGIDAYVSSNDAVVSAVLEAVRKAHIKTIFSFYEDEVEIVELAISDASPVTGKKLMEIVLPVDVLVAFVIQGDRIIVPTGQTVLQGGDIIALVSGKRSIAALEAIFGDRDGI